ncbi:MAG: MurR/RpiR family transcriptional regulator [Aerococcus sp.]|nr:MurR/RpiR family transcriptional regulator [Aerococcus sp.]
MRNVYLKELLRQNQLKFSPKEKKVAQYFMGLDNAIMNKTIAELASEINVSETTIFNFVKKLGFKGFQQFKIAIATHSQTLINEEKSLVSDKPLTEAIHSSDSYTVIAKKTFTIYHAYLNQMLQATLDMDFTEVLDHFRQLKNLYFLGVDTMKPLAELAYNKFIHSGRRVHVINESSAQSALASLLGPSDGVILLTPSVFTAQKLIYTLHQKQTPIILIAPKTQDPYLELVDLPILLPDESDNIDFHLIQHETLALGWLDMLYIALKPS